MNELERTANGGLFSSYTWEGDIKDNFAFVKMLDSHKDDKFIHKKIFMRREISYNGLIVDGMLLFDRSKEWMALILPLSDLKVDDWLRTLHTIEMPKTKFSSKERIVTFHFAQRANAVHEARE